MLDKKIKIKIFLYIYSFLFFFNPGNFFSFNLLYVLGFISVGYFFVVRGEFLNYISNKRILTLFVVCLFFVIYLVFLYLMGAEEALVRAYSFILIMISLFCVLTIFSIYKRVYSTDLSAVIQFFVGLGIIQLFFVILAVLIPEFREWTLITARQAEIHTISNDAGSGLRSFGLASGYTSTFPMFMGLCALFATYLFLNCSGFIKKILYLTVVIGFLLSIILNARIGFVPIAIFIFFAPLYLLYKGKATVFLLVPVLGLILLTSNTSLYKSSYFDRFFQGVEEIKLLTEGNSTGTFETLSHMWFFPSDLLDFFFGLGVNIIGRYPRGSDIGFVQDVFMYGFLMTIFLGFILLYVSLPLIRRFSKAFGFVFIFSFLGALFFYYLKGMNFYANEVCGMVLFLIVFTCLSRENNFSRSN